MISFNKKFLPLVFFLFIIVLIYNKQFIELIHQWWDDANYSHGFLIPLVSGYLIWEKREKLKTIEIKQSNYGLLVLIIGLLIYLVGTAAAEYFTVRFSLIIVIAGITWYLYGTSFVKELWFPLFFLIFMIPIPYVIYYTLTFPLQLFSSKIAAIILQTIGFPVLRQGNIIHLPNYSLEVVEACSGLRSLMTLSALGAAMAYFTQKSAWRGTLIFISSAPIAIAANIFRILLTAAGAMFISPRVAEGFLHEVSGIIVFLTGFLFLGITAIVIK